MKKFSQLAFPYIVWAILMLVFPMVLIALYSVTDQGNSILSFTFTLEHYANFFTDPDFLFILRAVREEAECADPCDHDPDVDQHAGKNVCMDRTLKRRRSDPENPAYGGTWKGITSLYRRGSASWYGI